MLRCSCPLALYMRSRAVAMAVDTDSSAGTSWPPESRTIRGELYRPTPELDALGQLTNDTFTIVDKNFSTLPEGLFALTSLRNLNLKGCSSLTSLPESLGKLSGLQSLYLGDCSSLTSLPASLGELGGLRVLDLTGCSSLTSLASLGELGGLEVLDLTGCSSLTSLPESLGELKGLKKLYMRSCSSLTSLPASLGELDGLEVLDLTGCSSLTSIPPPPCNLRLLVLRASYNVTAVRMGPRGKHPHAQVVAADGTKWDLGDWAPLRIQALQTAPANRSMFVILACFLWVASILALCTYSAFFSGFVPMRAGGDAGNQSPAFQLLQLGAPAGSANVTLAVAQSGTTAADAVLAAFRMTNGASFLLALLCISFSVVGILSLWYIPVFEGDTSSNQAQFLFIQRYGAMNLLLTFEGTTAILSLYGAAAVTLQGAFIAVAAAVVLAGATFLGYRGMGAVVIAIAAAAVLCGGGILYGRRRFKRLLSKSSRQPVDYDVEAGACSDAHPPWSSKSE